MKKLLLLACSIFVFTAWFPQESQTRTESLKSFSIEQAELRAASEKAIKLVQHSQAIWYKKQVCTSCHHQLLPEITLNLARERDVASDERAALENSTAAFSFLKDLDAIIQGYDYIDVLFDGLAISTARIAGVAPSLSTSAYAQFIASRQLPDGSWPTMDGRPPQAHSLFTTTAVCARAISEYMPERFKGEQERRLTKAREWLLRTEPRTTEDKAYQLFGLLWTGASADARQRAARVLLAEQREDGGWAQLPSMTSDAYATGEALVALGQAGGLAAIDPAYQRGLGFLLKTQRPDGSWYVKSRMNPPAPVSPPYFDAEFPYQHDQFISIMGTCWAVNAMLETLPARQWAKLGAQRSLDVAPAQQAEWMRVALNGDAAELKRLLDGGMSPNEKTAAGTTALMMAARDPEKVRLLLARGADVNASTSAGITPLMIASRYRGNREAVHLMLKNGAKPNPDKGIDVRNEASALMYAVMCGDLDIVKELVESGASIDTRMKVLGVFYTRPLVSATFVGDAAMAEYLISKGANPNDVDADGITALGVAAINNQPAAVQVLLARGAKVNHIDRFGMTPLLYAASADFGDTAVIERLIAGGANLRAKNKQGQTALNLANNYQYRALANLLSGKTARR